MRVLIIDADRKAVDSLAAKLDQADPSINAVGLSGCQQAERWLKTNHAPDLLIVDIDLNHADCFEFLQRIGISQPVIFTSHNSDFIFDALRHLCVDYLVKPVSSQALSRAISKFKLMSKAFVHLAGVEVKPGAVEQKYQGCFAAKQGKKTVLVPVSEISFFQAQNKSVIIADKDNNRFVSDRTLAELEPMLDPVRFFRINRKMIVRGMAIRAMKPHVNNRISLNFPALEIKETVIVSRDRSPAFRKWIAGIADQKIIRKLPNGTSCSSQPG